MSEKVINIAKDFSRYPAGRYLTDGDFSGQRFREEFLIPVVKSKERAVIELDGVRGYGSSFLEEAFGGLVREGFTVDEVKSAFTITSSDSSLIEEIMEYVEYGADAS